MDSKLAPSRSASVAFEFNSLHDGATARLHRFSTVNGSNQDDDAIRRGTIPDDSILVYAPRPSKAQNVGFQEPEWLRERSEVISTKQASQILADYGKQVRTKPNSGRKIPSDVLTLAKLLSQPQKQQVFYIPPRRHDFETEGTGIMLRPASAYQASAPKSRNRTLSAPVRISSASHLPLGLQKEATPAKSTTERLNELAQPRVKASGLFSARIKASTVREWTQSSRLALRFKLKYAKMDLETYKVLVAKQWLYQQKLQKGKNQLIQETAAINSHVQKFCDELEHMTLNDYHRTVLPLSGLM